MCTVHWLARPRHTCAALFDATNMLLCRYGLPALRKECVKVMISSLSLETTPTFALLAHEHSCPDLMQVGPYVINTARLSAYACYYNYHYATSGCFHSSVALLQLCIHQSAQRTIRANRWLSSYYCARVTCTLLQACVGYAAASPERLSQVLGSPSYLHLTEACPRVGQAFVHAAMQQLLAK